MSKDKVVAGKKPTTLAECESILREHAQSSNRASEAVLVIYNFFTKKDPQVKKWKTLEDYALEVWGLKPTNTRYLLGCGRLLEVGSDPKKLPNAAQLDKLKKVKPTRAEEGAGVTYGEKQKKAWDEVKREKGPDISPEDLEEELKQRAKITPRASKNKLDKEEQKAKLRREALGPITKKFQAIVNGPTAQSLVKKWGPMNEWSYYAEFTEWLERGEEASGL